MNPEHPSPSEPSGEDEIEDLLRGLEKRATQVLPLSSLWKRVADFYATQDVSEETIGVLHASFMSLEANYNTLMEEFKVAPELEEKLEVLRRDLLAFFSIRIELCESGKEKISVEKMQAWFEMATELLDQVSYWLRPRDTDAG